MIQIVSNEVIRIMHNCFHATQTSPGSFQVFDSLGLVHASVEAKNLGSV